MVREFARRSAAIGIALLAFGARSRGQEQAPVPSVDATDREQVTNLYRQYYLPGNDATPGWTGDLGAGDPGTLSEAYRAATLQRINYYRAMCGLTSNLTFGSTEDGECQQAALMMAAEGNISHTPPSSWPFYTSDAAQACANSNIRLDSVGDEGPGAVDRFMADDEVNNADVGHRRWFLYPDEGEMGSGAIPPSDAYAGTAAIWIMNFVPRPSGTPAYYSWPNAGYVPANLVYNRWSFSYLNADFTQATVSVTKNGASIPVNLETPQYQSSNSSDIIVGDNTLVWELPGNTVSTTQDETYAVHVGQVMINGVPQDFDYTVTTIDAEPVQIGLTVPGPVAHRNNPTPPGRIKLSRDGDLTAPLTVSYSVAGTATPGERYVALSGNVTFPAGSAMAKIKVVPIAAPGLRGKRTVLITLLPGADYTLGSVTSGTINVQN
jgi:hypothetical protein